MRKTLVRSCIGCLLAGILSGGLLPMPWDSEAPAPLSPPIIPGPSDPPEVAAFSADRPEGPDSQDNFPLLNTACHVVRALKEEDYQTVASLVHPEKGVTFTPYSTVDFETDLTFTPDQIRALTQDSTVYTWGFEDGRGTLLHMTLSQYVQECVFDADYTQAPHIAVDQIVLSGNALENLTEAYPGCRFVDFCFPGQDPASQGTDWTSLKLVFEPGETGWLLVGVVHGEWTV